MEEKLPIYTFSSFSEEQARRMFGLKPQLKPEGYISDWLKNAEKEEITGDDKKLLKRLQRKLELFVRGWNEQELREKVIAHLVETVDFDMYDLEIVSFSEREMKVVYDKKIIQGKVESRSIGMVANGIFEPQHPFFFIHVDPKGVIPTLFGKYKREKSKDDPVGQLLATLSSAQILNNEQPKPNLFQKESLTFSDVPLYGIYIIGRLWFFTRLKGKKYYISTAYDSTKMKDLEFILKMLKAQKKMIIKEIEKLNLIQMV